jgi:pimeloyl-ACP methyl ester carboxylesterase
MRTTGANPPSPTSPWSLPALLFLLVAALPVALHGQSAAYPEEPPAAPPPEWGAVSVNMEDVPYPHPVEFMDLRLFGKDLRMAYMDVPPSGEPNGRTAVLLHGASYYGMYWEETIEALREAGFRVVVPDQIGWGRSSKPVIPYSLHLHAANTHRLLGHLGISEAAVAGHSMGGMLATRFALMYPEATTHMVMVNPIGVRDTRAGRGWQEPSGGGSVEDLQQAYESRLQLEQRRVVDWKPEFLEHVRIHYGWLLSSEWPRVDYVRSLNANARSIDTIVHDWPQIETKSAFIAGEEDGPGYPDLARDAVAALPNAELVLFPNVGHNPHLEAPELFLPELIRFLESDPNARVADGDGRFR